MSISIVDYSVVSPLGIGKPLHANALRTLGVASDYSLHCTESELLDQLWSPLQHWVKGVSPQRIGIVISNSKNPPMAPAPYNAALDIASRIGAGAIPYSLSAACATGLVSVIQGMVWLERGWVDRVIVGSLETSKVPLIEAGFYQMGVLSKQGTCRPFMQDRDGFVIGEGGALFVLMRSDDAETSMAKIEKGQMMADPTDILALDSTGESISTLIRRTIGEETVDYINAHGTGTRLNDLAELSAFERVFHDKRPLISSTKALTGHLLGATGAVELALCLQILSEQIIVPVKIFDPLPDNLMPGMQAFQSNPQEINRILTLNYGFGGHLAALMIARP